MARLMEEYYGLRKTSPAHLEKMRSYIEMASGQNPDISNSAEIQKILKRLTIQLDGERISQPAYADDFKKTVTLYLQLFPNTPERFKMCEGWLAAESESPAKIDRIKEWLGNQSLKFTESERFKLHETMAALAQQSKNWLLAAEEMRVLSELCDGIHGDCREYAYHQARALYELKDYQKSLPIFTKLAASAAETGVADKWALQSQHLALDILAQKKEYLLLAEQARSWLKSEKLRTTSAKELSEMAQIADQAVFENAVLTADRKSALTSFKEFCLSGKFKPKSCENAKVLAVTLKDEGSLIEILKSSGLTAELAAEYESASYFTLAAQMLEPLLQQKANIEAYLKTALLYELGESYEKRDLLLQAAVKLVRKNNSFGNSEQLLLQTILDANLHESKLLQLPWSPESKALLAESLETSGKGTPETRKILLSSTKNTGPSWSKLVLSELNKLDNAQGKISFHGKNSKRKFELRIAGIAKLSKSGEKFLQTGGTHARAAILTLLHQAHEQLAKEILESPLPENSTKEVADELHSALEKMAGPFLAKAKAYIDLIPSTTTSSGITDQITTPAAAPLREIHKKTADQAIEALHKNPSDKSALLALKEYYESSGKQRLASYFSGRMLSLEKDGEGK
ncbi:MAG: hypothetical protein AABZ06_07560 [Bdellovibrionota bacterium]